MSKPGPKPKDGERYASGKLKGEKFQGPHPAQVRKMLDVVKAKASDPLLSSTVGWLLFHKKITARQVSAAVAYATLRGQFHRVMGFRPRTAASPSYELGYGVVHEGEGAEKQAMKVRERHEKLLVRRMTPKQVQLLDRTCIDDQQPGSWEISELSSALEGLATELGLTA